MVEVRGWGWWGHAEASLPRSAPAASWHGAGLCLVGIHQQLCPGLLFAPPAAGGENGGVMAIPGLATRHPGVCKLHHVSVRGVGYLLEMP